MKHDSSALSEVEAKRILARAAELDASGTGRFSLAELQQIAQEASIDLSALDQALREGVDVPRQSPLVPERVRTLGKAAGLAGIGAGLGALSVFADSLSLGPESAAAVFAPSAAFILYRALWHRWHGGVRGYVEDAILVLGSFTLTATLTGGFDATLPALVWSVVAGKFGAVVASVRFQLRAGSREAEQLRTPADNS
jgi:hypothetical protein